MRPISARLHPAPVERSGPAWREGQCAAIDTDRLLKRLIVAEFITMVVKFGPRGLMLMSRPAAGNAAAVSADTRFRGFIIALLHLELDHSPDSGGDSRDPAPDPSENRLIGSVLQEIPNARKHDAPLFTRYLGRGGATRPRSHLVGPDLKADERIGSVRRSDGDVDGVAAPGH
jgi:hypothetical protein